MTSVRLILEVTMTGALLARAIDEPIIVVAANLADLQEKLAERFTSRGCKPVVVAVRAAEAAPSEARL
jgi:hypothetical protein